ncbi:MAG TPA: hypothetical protein VKQ72_00825 [Aggregatilineales bacterium]|nr:hypothetical protein [Aggregatilineales bacterium]
MQATGAQTRRGFVSLCALLVFLVSTLILAARLVGSTQTNTLKWVFDNPDGIQCKTPCLLGIQPGWTTMSDAITILARHPFSKEMIKQPSANINSYVEFYSEEAVVLLGPGGGSDPLVDSVGLYRRSGPPTGYPPLDSARLNLLNSLEMGNLAQFVEPPDFAAGNRFSEGQGISVVTVTICYRRSLLCADVADKLSPQSNVDLTIYAPGDDLTVRMSNNLLICHWLGFAQIQRYLDPARC